VADDLRRQADEFLDLVHLIPRVGRDPGERNARPVPDRFTASPADTGTRSRGETPERSARPSPALETRYGIRQGDEPQEG
jgi:hypothetical protein